MSRLEALRNASTLHDISHLLGFKPSAVAYILYKKSDDSKYCEFEISKKNGGTRKIKAPISKLKNLQKRLADLLQDCIEEIDKEKNIKSTLSHGFKRNYSIVTNAKMHKRKKFVLNTDIEDFFGAINFGRVRGFFIKNNSFSLNPKIATIIAQISCHDNSLPQGAPSSPVISNLIAHILDLRLAKLAKQNSCTYSRYADDITFSTNLKKFPEKIAKLKNDSENEWIMGREAKKIFISTGFHINTRKTRMQFYKTRQDVTGLTVNKKVNTNKLYRRRVRAMADSLFKQGSFFIDRSLVSNDENDSTNKIEGNLDMLAGMLEHIDYVDRQSKIKQKNLPYRSKTSRESIYSRFIFYKDFYANEKPVVLCEGKTDNIYLTEALKALKKSYPMLSLKKKDQSLDILAKFYNYTRRSESKLGLSGGASQIKNFIEKYEKTCSKFSTKPSKEPIIIVIDNDKGSVKIFSLIKELTKSLKKIDGNDLFYKISKKLYIVAIPRKNNNDTMIEDLFDPALLSTKIKGKTLSLDDKFDTSKHYGKAVFAEKVVKPNKEDINFSGFSNLLHRISLSILDSKKTHK